MSPVKEIDEEAKAKRPESYDSSKIQILEGLELGGAIKKGDTLHVDILKVPHHGSSNNLERGFFERITADHYVFSGDGEHGNPERETMEMLFAARGSEPFTIHLTYPIDDIDVNRARAAKEQGMFDRLRDGATTIELLDLDPGAVERS